MAPSPCPCESPARCGQPCHCHSPAKELTIQTSSPASRQNMARSPNKSMLQAITRAWRCLVPLALAPSPSAPPRVACEMTRSAMPNTTMQTARFALKQAYHIILGCWPPRCHQKAKGSSPDMALPRSRGGQHPRKFGQCLAVCSMHMHVLLPDACTDVCMCPYAHTCWLRVGACLCMRACRPQTCITICPCQTEKCEVRCLTCVGTSNSDMLLTHVCLAALNCEQSA